MRRSSFSEKSCSVAQCLEIVGEWWSFLIIRDAFLGVRRFDDFRARLGISRNILTLRLKRLTEHGILQQVVYQQHPPRYEYRLTDKGRDLWHVLTAMRQWGDKWAAPDGPPLITTHTRCGRLSETVAVCSACGEPLDPRELTGAAGPGAAPGAFDRTAIGASLTGVLPRPKRQRAGWDRRRVHDGRGGAAVRGEQVEDRLQLLDRA